MTSYQKEQKLFDIVYSGKNVKERLKSILTEKQINALLDEIHLTVNYLDTKLDRKENEGTYRVFIDDILISVSEGLFYDEE